MKEFFKQLSYVLNKIKLSFIRKFIRIPVNKKIKRGFIIIQIDGLSFNTLHRALKEGYLPKVNKHIIANNNFHIKKFYSGFPSNTPNFQKTIMFGDEKPLPGFRWYDKYEKNFYSFTSPDTAEKIEKNYKNNGILKDGVSYYNLFSGSADRAYITLSKILTTNLSSRITGFKLLLIIFSNIFTILKILLLSVKEFLYELRDMLYFYFNDLSNRDFIFFPFLRILNNVFIQEYLVHAISLEIICGTPKIYVTFNAYDEISHQRGPFHRSSLKVLKSIDKAIFRIFKFAYYSKIRKYDFYILSDHGEAPSIPFNKLFRKDLEVIIKNYNKLLKVSSNIENQFQKENFNLLILKKIKQLSIERQIPPIISKMIRDFQTKDIKPAEITIVNFGPVAHIYLTNFNFKLDFKEINSEYPLLLVEILSHKGIGFIVVNQDTSTLLLFKDGYLLINNGEIIKCELNHEKNLFANSILKNKLLIKDIEAFAQLKNSGDIIIFSNIISDGLINFEYQFSCHGGIEFEQTDAFIIYPFYKKNYFNEIKETKNLYNFFKTNY